VEFQDVVRKRRMIRNFSSDPVEDDVRDRILHNALRGPSAGYSQGWAFMTFEGTEETESFWNVSFRGRDRSPFRWQGLFNAPLIIVPFASMDDYLDRYAELDKGWSDRDPNRWPVPFWHIDTGMATLLMLQTVVDAGLGALFLGIFRPDEFKEAFGVPETHMPIGAIVIGRPLPDEPSPSLKRGRRPLEEVVHRARW